MVKLKVRSLSDTTKVLLNPGGKKTDCPCCCDNLPPQLYVHLEPEFSDSDCEESDTGQLSTRIDWFADEVGGPANACNQWDTNLTTQATPADPLECTSGGSGNPPVVFGMGISLYCRPVNEWWVDICFADAGVPDYPNTSGCDQLLLNIQSTNSANRTCERCPGGFLVDIGSVTPLGDNTSLTIYGTNVSGTPSACDCTFRLWIDEDPNGALSPQQPVMYYPAEGAGGHPEHFNSLWNWEHTPGVGTPQHPAKPPTMGKRVGVGTRLGRRLARAGINYRQAGGNCNCSQLIIDMNRTTPEQILANIDDWSAKVQESARMWFRNLPKTTGGYMKQALRPLAWAGVKSLIKKACSDELEGRLT